MGTGELSGLPDEMLSGLPVMDHPGPVGGYSGMFWVGMCRPGLQVWTPF